MSTHLDALARHHGIALTYRDIWSHEQRAEPTVLRALLRAMHVNAEDDAAVEAALTTQRREQWRRVVPMVSLARGPHAPVTLRLPARWHASVWHWRVVEENGREHSGELGANEWPELERASIDNGEHVAIEWRLPIDLPEGYHRLQVARAADGSQDDASNALMPGLLIVAPATCHSPRALRANARTWGVAVQVHALRSARNWGMGDFTDLAAVVEFWGQRGAAIVGVNPLHALFPHNPAHISPYSPSSRRFLNALYLDIEAVPESTACAALQAWLASDAVRAQLDALRALPLIDHAGVAALKWPALGMLFEHFGRMHIARGTPRARAFEAFCTEQGSALLHHALFESLQEHFHRADAAVWGWPVWPEAYRQPNAPAVQRFAEQHRERVQFYQLVQWLCDEQLGAVAQRAQALGIGLYNDLAVAADRAGADAWSDQQTLALDVSIGAPPDEFNRNGQNWGLPPPIPHALEHNGFAPFIQTVRAAMRHAGALRIDHVMALMRLYWIAGSGSAAHGAFVRYPFEVLLAIVRLESQRQRCAVIGEALGTLPDGLREQLADSGMLSYRVLIFERDAHGFAAPAQLPRDALASASTHDLPTLAGWWQGRDIDVRAQLGWIDAPAAQAAHQARARECEQLLQALQREDLLPAGTDLQAAAHAPLTPTLLQAVHRYLARCPSKIVLLQIEDALLQIEQVNLPGTTDSHPNWRRKLALGIEQWPADESMAELARAMVQERGLPERPGSAIIPRATYRVQLSRGFTFAHAKAVVPYLAALGISHLYTSPFLRARAGSTHGYDIVDHNAIHPDIGTRAELDALVAELERHGMSLLIDVVPNHMGVHGGDNAWWLDVLECGPASAYADHFDIDWHASDPALHGRVLLPILGDQYGLVLERHELRLHFDAAHGRIEARYHDHRLPIDPRGYGEWIRTALDRKPACATHTLRTLVAAFGDLPARDDAAHREQRRHDKRALQAQLARCASEGPGFAAALASALAAASDAHNLDALDALLSAQAYRVAHWRIAADEINYRRFFDINDLAALRMERAEVFEATHALVLSLTASGAVAGLRIDHSDGLADPAAYFQRLQQRHAELSGLVADASARRSLYIVTEKITAPHEHMPTDWAVHGTTGYRFANVVNGLLVDGNAKLRLDRTWRAFVRDEAEDFDELSWRCRHIVMESSLAGELTVLSTALWRLAREDRRTRDFSLQMLRRALAAVVASFPVYRTYVTEAPSAADRRTIDWAIGRARRRSPWADTSVFDFVRRALLGRPLTGAPSGLSERYRSFARRIQQYTAPVAAKGIEDTALYRHHRLISLNDVGSDPDDFGITVSAFHGASRDRAQHWPHTLLATSTHDSKRSEDVRARIDVLSEMPAAWRLTVRRWSRLNRCHKRQVDGLPAPSRNDEYLLYQTLAGSLPSGDITPESMARYADRIEQAMLKSARESKARTSWAQQHAAYEAALSSFVRAALDPRESNLFWPDVRETSATLAWYGALNGLTLALVKGLSPGVPDYYQGHETIELTLVDPDNRRPVDYAHRQRLLQQAHELEKLPQRAATLREWQAQAPDGRAKFWIAKSVLRVRQAMEMLYRHPVYVPLEVHGPRAEHLIAFAVRDEHRCVIAVAARLYATLGLAVGEIPPAATWRDTDIVWPAGDGAVRPVALIDEITGTHAGPGPRWPVADVLRDCPVAALHGRIEAAA